MVGLLHGLLRSRLVAEELAQETFLVAYRNWDRVSALDNPRANALAAALQAYSVASQARRREASR